MISRTPRFAGAVAAVIAGSFAAILPCSAQAPGSSTAGLFDAVLHSGVSGVVRDRTGKPQIGVMVELLDAQYGVLAHTFTDDRGRYTLPRLRAGLYQIKASDSLFLPTIRPNLRLLANSRVIVNLTLSTLYQALQWLPAEPRRTQTPNDDWDWTLRLSANRPLLRMFDPNTVQVAGAPVPAAAQQPALLQTGDSGGPDSTTHQLALRSGLRQFGQGGVVQQMIWTGGDGETHAMLFGAQSSADASGVGRISTTGAYRQQLTPDRSMLTVVTLTDRPQIAAGGEAGLTTMHVRSASTVQLGDMAEVSAGTELEAARFGDGATAFGSHPFASLSVQSGNSTVAYQISTAPTMTAADKMQQEAENDAPAVVEQDGALYLEQGLHQELSLNRTAGHWTGAVGVFDDSLRHPLVEGALSGNEAAVDSRDVLYDPGTGTIAVSGAGYSGAGGVLAMLRDQLNPDTWLSLRYALGEAVTLPQGAPDGSNLTAFASPFAAKHSSMLAVAAGTRIPGIETVVHGSYRWQPVDTLTPVAPFESDIPDAYLSFALRQPLHLQRVGTGRLEAIVEVRNLLAQGYRPFLSQDGTTVYFAQEQRCIAAGVAFSF